MEATWFGSSCAVALLRLSTVVPAEVLRDTSRAPAHNRTPRAQTAVATTVGRFPPNRLLNLRKDRGSSLKRLRFFRSLRGMYLLITCCWMGVLLFRPLGGQLVSFRNDRGRQSAGFLCKARRFGHDRTHFRSGGSYLGRHGRHGRRVSNDLQVRNGGCLSVSGILSGDARKEKL